MVNYRVLPPKTYNVSALPVALWVVSYASVLEKMNYAVLANPVDHFHRGCLYPVARAGSDAGAAGGSLAACRSSPPPVASCLIVGEARRPATSAFSTPQAFEQ